MKKFLLLITLVVVSSTLALGNPIFEDKAAKGTNPLYQERCGIGGDCDDTDRDVRPGRLELIEQTWGFDPDSDGDGILTLEETNTVLVTQGEVVSAVKSERKPKFKAGAELSKTVNSADLGDLDGDGLADVVVSIDSSSDSLKLTGDSISKRSARTGFYRTSDSMSKPELVEAIASKSGLYKADSKKILDSFFRTVSR